jgi:NAD(P)H-flavin reductase
MTQDSAWEGETRRIDAEMLRDHLGEELGSYAYLIAGPPAMVDGVAEALQGAGISEDQVRPARFSGY